MAATQPPVMSIGIHVAAIGSLPAPPTARSNPVRACISGVVAGEAGPGARWGRTRWHGSRPPGGFKPGDGLLVDAEPLGDADAEVVEHHVGPPAGAPRRRAGPPGAPRSRATLRLPRWQHGDGVGGGRAWPRRPGGSILTTSAPRSASTSAASGPATKAEKSATRSPSSSRLPPVPVRPSRMAAPPGPCPHSLRARDRGPGSWRRRVIGRGRTVAPARERSEWPTTMGEPTTTSR